MTIENKFVPKGAMQLIDKGCQAEILMSLDSEGQEAPKLEMTVYSGGVIKNHWYWDDLIMDLDGIKFSKKKYPILEDHSTERKIGFSGKPVVVDGQLKLDATTVQFVDTECSNDFQKLSKQGFPFQASIRATPKRIERIEEGSETQANGLTLKGPGTIWREWEYMEGSVCVFGWDTNTNSAAFSKDEISLDYELTEVKKDVFLKETPKIMNIEQFMKDHPDLYAGIVKQATDQAVGSFSKEKTELTSTIETLTVALAENRKEVQELSKQNAIRTERELFSDSEVIWTKKLVASEVPERMFGKVKKNVDYSKFVNDDKLDVSAFSLAIDEELKDWSEFLKIKEPNIQGTGFSQKEISVDSSTISKENQTIADELFALSGAKK